MLTITQRFTPQSPGWAPVSWGCPSMTIHIDHTVFKKSMEEKWKLYNFKKEFGKTRNHNFELQFKGQF